MLALLLVRHFCDPREVSKPSALVAWILLTAVLIPYCYLAVDVENSGDGSHAFSTWSDGIYLACFIVAVLSVFVLGPLAFFYDESDNPATSPAVRLRWAALFSSIVLAILLVLLALGAMTRLSALEQPQNKDAGMQWVWSVLEDPSTMDVAFMFVFCAAVCLGLLLWATVAAIGSLQFYAGLCGQPAHEVAVSTQFHSERDELEREAQDVMEEQRSLLSRHVLPGHRVDSATQRRLRELATRRSVLSSRAARLQEPDTTLEERLPVLALLRRFLAFLLVVMAASLWMVVLISVAQGVVHQMSDGTSRVGWVVSEVRESLTVLDHLAVSASRSFPLDAAVLLGACATASLMVVRGMEHTGVRLLWVPLFPLRKRATMPQGVLLFAMNAAFLAAGWAFILHTAAPQYVTFGHQMFKPANSTVDVNCAVAGVVITATPAPAGNSSTTPSTWMGYRVEESLDGRTAVDDVHSPLCRVSRFSRLVLRTAVTMPAFGVAFVFAQAVFLLATIGWCCFGGIERVQDRGGGGRPRYQTV